MGSSVPLSEKWKSIDTSPGYSYPQSLEVRLSPERQAQLNDYAHRHGQDPAIALDEVLAAALEWERQDYQEAVEGIGRGYDDLKAGHGSAGGPALVPGTEK